MSIVSESSDSATSGGTPPRPMRADTTTRNHFLSGNFAPVTQERVETDLPITGSLPPALNGTLLRDGPNPIVDPGPNYHWFLGDGMVHAIDLRDGEAVGYRNRWVRTAEVAAQLGGTAPPRLDQGMGSGAVNVVPHAGRIIALGEAGFAFELDADLNTIGQLGFDGRFEGNFTAHPKIDPVTGEMIAFGYDFFGINLRYFRIYPTGDLTQLSEISTPRPTMMHDFGVTQTRVVFMDLPVVFDLGLVASGKFPFAWDPRVGARLGVMPRDGASDGVNWIDIDPCYVFHPLNAYDDDERIVMDVVRFDQMFATDHQGPDSFGSLYRWTIDPATGSVDEQQIDDRSIEFPRVNPTFVTRPHRYGYTAQIRADGSFTADALLKFDLESGTSETHCLRPEQSASEAVFVSDPDRQDAEDGGWVLSVVYDASTDRSDLIVVDAQDFAGDPVATVHLPVRVPFGFHGNWCPAD